MSVKPLVVGKSVNPATDYDNVLLQTAVNILLVGDPLKFSPEALKAVALGDNLAPLYPVLDTAETPIFDAIAVGKLQSLGQDVFASARRYISSVFDDASAQTKLMNAKREAETLITYLDTTEPNNFDVLFPRRIGKRLDGAEGVITDPIAEKVLTPA